MVQKELNRRRVPDFLKGISSLDAWKLQRESIKKLFLENEYGFLPQRVVPSVEKIEENWVDFAGKGKWESIYLRLENDGRAHTVRTDLILPSGVKNPPVFLYIAMNPEIPSKYLPVEEILDKGFGIYTYYYQDVTSDSDKRDGLAYVFDKAECGKISLWAYMASICMDYLEKNDDIDLSHVAIVGHSRLGKTALLASALDERFMLTCSNNSGCCGAALSRGKIDANENIEKITRVFPFWFCKKFFEYIDNEDKLPFDQHMFLSLIAPRYLMIGAAIKDVWADNEGQLLSCMLASSIWSLYGKEGLEPLNEFPTEGAKYLSGRVCFHLRRGTHFLSRDDWQIYMEKFEKILNDEKNA